MHAQGTRAGDRDRRPHAAAPLLHHAGRWAGGWSRCAGCSKARRRCSTRQAVLQRQDLLTRYPAYEQLRGRPSAAQEARSPCRWCRTTTPCSQATDQALAQLAGLGQQQEAILREMAVRREPAAWSFRRCGPPPTSRSAAQGTRPAGVLRHQPGASTASCSNNEPLQRLAAQAVTPQRSAARRSAPAARDGQLPAEPRDLRSRTWPTASGSRRPTSCSMRCSRARRADFAEKFDELVIVPDGVLWYVPFEALQVKVGGAVAAVDFALPHPLRAHGLAGGTVPPAWTHRRRQHGGGRWAGCSRGRTTRRRTRRSSSWPRRCPAAWRCRSPLPAPSAVYATRDRSPDRAGRSEPRRRHRSLRLAPLAAGSRQARQAR